MIVVCYYRGAWPSGKYACMRVHPDDLCERATCVWIVPGTWVED